MLVARHEPDDAEWKLSIGFSTFAETHFGLKADEGCRADPVPAVTFLSTKCKREIKRI